jgi:hypothetical protein
VKVNPDFFAGYEELGEPNRARNRRVAADGADP